MATRTVFAKFDQILAQVWQGEGHFSILRHFGGLASLTSLKIVAGESGDSDRSGESGKSGDSGRFADCI